MPGLSLSVEPQDEKKREAKKSRSNGRKGEMAEESGC